LLICILGHQLSIPSRVIYATAAEIMDDRVRGGSGISIAHY
jgi:hypothetical protein